MIETARITREFLDAAYNNSTTFNGISSPVVMGSWYYIRGQTDTNVSEVRDAILHSCNGLIMDCGLV